MPTRPVRPVASGEKRVLLVDPDPLLRRLRAEVLRQAGYRVFPSTDLEAALTRVKPGAFDLIAVSSDGETAAALEFCEQARARAPQQLVLVITRPNEYVPQNSCPDEVVNDGPERLVEQVSSALAG